MIIITTFYVCATIENKVYLHKSHLFRNLNHLLVFLYVAGNKAYGLSLVSHSTKTIHHHHHHHHHHIHHYMHHFYSKELKYHLNFIVLTYARLFSRYSYDNLKISPSEYSENKWNTKIILNLLVFPVRFL